MGDRTQNRDALIELIQRGAIAKAQREPAMQIAGISAGSGDWRHFADRFLLAVGALALVAAVGFFVAYNWLDMGRLGKFALIQLTLAAAVLLPLIRGQAGLAERFSLLAASILVGVLLAFYGQTYQTGADPWQLFFVWAVLITPWVLLSHFPPQWVLWLGLLNLSVYLFEEQAGGWLLAGIRPDVEMFVSLFALNGAALVVAEWRCAGQRDHLRWALRLLAVAAGLPLTLLAVWALLRSSISPAWLLLWAAWCSGMWWFYRARDLFVLAGLCLALISVSSTLLGKLVLRDLEVAGFLIMALALVGQSTAAAYWLRLRYREGLS